MKKIYLLIMLVSLGALLYFEYLQMVRSENRARLHTISSQLDADIGELGNQSLQVVTAKLTGRLAGETESPEWVDTLTSRINASLAELASGDNWRLHPQFISTILKIEEQQNVPVPRSITSAVARIEQALPLLGPDLDNLFKRIGATDPSSIHGSVNNVIALSDAITSLTRDLQGKLNPGAVMTERIGSFISGGIAFLCMIGLFWSVLGDFRNTRLAVTRLLDETRGLEQGDLTVKAQVTGDVTAGVANSLNHTVVKMHDLVTGIRQDTREVTQTAAKTEESMARLKAWRVSQSGQITDCANDVTNLSGRIYEISQSAEQSTSHIRECAELAQQGMNTIQDTAQGMDTVRSQAGEARNYLQRLAEGVLQIRTIADSIRGLTEQTHTLSLNASIQATGETGQDFAGTAEQIQELAERSTYASNEIDELVESIRQDADHALTCIQAINREMVSGATRTDQVQHTVNEIRNLSQPLPEIMSQLSDEWKDELRTIEKFGKRMQELQDSAAEAWLDISQIAVALEKTKLAANRLKQSTGGFRISDPRSGNG